MRCVFESPKCAKMRLQLGLHPGPTGGDYSAPPGPLAGFGESGEGKGRGRREGP